MLFKRLRKAIFCLFEYLEIITRIDAKDALKNKKPAI
ncbi:hypothetical protein V12G01_12340 [Vibrio alginolyticus 12G01]|nr:hypothetical protein V12G01_12340 [Vibrio alginolyticus 12G01]